MSIERCFAVKLDRDGRITIPAAVVRSAGWLRGDVPLQAWLIIGNSGRCRVLPPAQLENDELAIRLRTAADATTALAEAATRFEDEAVESLAFRLVPLELFPPGPGWRFLLPKWLALIMGVESKERSVALLHLHGYIEIWNLELLRASLDKPISDLV
jgi:bifunctional DNA-binding transcriptional regulator/antitoxin component of YhaV-PrlF toxin-antitoxin module